MTPPFTVCYFNHERGSPHTCILLTVCLYTLSWSRKNRNLHRGYPNRLVASRGFRPLPSSHADKGIMSLGSSEGTKIVWQYGSGGRDSGPFGPSDAAPVINTDRIGGGIRGMNLAVRKPPDVAKHGGNSTRVAQGLGIHGERVEQAVYTTLPTGVPFRLPKTAKRRHCTWSDYLLPRLRWVHPQEPRSDKRQVHRSRNALLEDGQHSC